MKGGNLVYQDNHQNFNSPINLHMRAGCHPFEGLYKEWRMNARVDNGVYTIRRGWC